MEQNMEQVKKTMITAVTAGIYKTAYHKIIYLQLF